MALSRLVINQFRNIEFADLRFHPRLNFVYGINGAGKSSLLEAMNCIALGRSHRTRKYGSVIKEGANQFDLFGELICDDQSYKLGLSRAKTGQMKVKINGEFVNKLADLAKLSPVQVINNQSFQLLEGGPLERRRFLDWLVFHVKHEYGDLWSAANKCLKQRNALLKSPRFDKRELDLWNEKLIELTEKITQARRVTLERFKDHLSGFLNRGVNNELGSLCNIELEYYQGWSKAKEYGEALKDCESSDIKQGFTSIGFHKADVLCHQNGNNVSELFSRGQLKRFISVLILTQVQYIAQDRGRNCLLLIDDLPSELDDENQKLVANWVKALPHVQVMVTGIEQNRLIQAWYDNDLINSGFHMFHVKHGTFIQDSSVWSKT